MSGGACYDRSNSVEQRHVTHGVTYDNSGEPGFELVPDARETWQRIFLLPGLELMLRADAQTVARITAQRICSDYAIRRA